MSDLNPSEEIYGTELPEDPDVTIRWIMEMFGERAQRVSVENKLGGMISVTSIDLLPPEEGNDRSASGSERRKITGDMIDRARAALEPRITGTIRPEDMRAALEAALDAP